MTLTFYLLRHAKAEPHSLQKDDIDRALAERGRSDAWCLGEHFAAQQSFALDHIWCSSAARTRETLEYVRQGYTNSCSPLEGEQLRTSASDVRNVGGKYADNTHHGSIEVSTKPDLACPPSRGEREVFSSIKFEKKLYHASADKMLEVLQLTPPDARSVMMVGHNPGISELAAALAGRGDEKLIRDVQLKFPTCALATYEFHCASWQQAGPGNSEITGFWVPER